jgi:FK506-binding protein 6
MLICLYKIGGKSASVIYNCRYRKAVSLLEKCRLKDEEDEVRQQRMLLKLYINLAVCYNKQKTSRRACIMCRNALDIQPRNAKALFK